MLTVCCYPSLYRVLKKCCSAVTQPSQYSITTLAVAAVCVVTVLWQGNRACLKLSFYLSEIQKNTV